MSLKTLFDNVERVEDKFRENNILIWTVLSALTGLAVAGDYFGLDGQDGLGPIGASLTFIPGIPLGIYGVTILYGLARYGKLV